MSRKDLLDRLIKFDPPDRSILQALSKFDWDTEQPVVELTSRDIIALLDRYISGELSLHDVEYWADALEVRDDVGFPPDRDDLVKDAISRLANPDLHRPLDLQEAKDLKAKLIG